MPLVNTRAHTLVLAPAHEDQFVLTGRGLSEGCAMIARSTSATDPPVVICIPAPARRPFELACGRCSNPRVQLPALSQPG